MSERNPDSGKLWAVVQIAGDRAELPAVDSYSGFGGDLYTTRAEALDILGLTRATFAIHAPDRRYVLAQVVYSDTD